MEWYNNNNNNDRLTAFDPGQPLQMEKDDKGSTMIRMGVSGWMFLLVPAYPGLSRIKGR